MSPTEFKSSGFCQEKKDLVISTLLHKDDKTHGYAHSKGTGGGTGPSFCAQAFPSEILPAHLMTFEGKRRDAGEEKVSVKTGRVH